MITLKCKMCGGALELAENTTVAECEYCGTRQTLPKLDDEKKTALFDRANLCRSRNEFDKAAVIYENILNDALDEAEAYWGLCLCRYGIEYVVDPKTQKRIPTCHRTQFKSILDDSDYKATIKYADILAKDVYRTEAEYIDKVQKDILAISSKEEPFDIFICYKETDENGDRTKDSVIAQDIYTELTDKGYKVFFSRITLEDKLGTAYEPYIFAALNSAKIMLVVGTNPEYYEAVWVRNEWNRFLSLIENGQKKIIIPCYRDMTVNEMPKEFTALQSLDVSKIGYMQDLLRGINKILTPVKENTSINATKTFNKNMNMISYIQSIGGYSADDLWPKGPISPIINKDNYNTVSFQIFLHNPIEIDGNIVLEFTVLDEMGNVVCQDVSNVYVKPENDRFSKLWILKGSDGSSVEDGYYKAVFKINDSSPKEYKFRVTSNKVTDFDVKKTINKFFEYRSGESQTKSEKSIVTYVILCLFLGYFGVHSFYVGKKMKGILQLILAPIGITPFWVCIDLLKAIITRKIPTKE